MPTYGYRCEKNGHEFEVVQSFSDPPLKRCKICGSKVNRIFYPVGIVFKGPGFYATDNRGGSASVGSDKSESESKSDGVAAAKAETKTEAKSEGKAKPKSDSKSKTGSAAKKS
ncbi:MAG TPA: FmdB family zinc ribbon protein [Candidatus Solibacter sp.]|jgi:putative FmdB family regulatory protein|nr:FmdB family zinc ribbon protein [Candidatus Solibacter sp.]